MRLYFRLLFVCVILAFFSVLYVFEQLASSLESGPSWREPGLKRKRADTARTKRGDAHSQPRYRYNPPRCKSMSVTHWNPYWRLPSDVCGKNCFMESAFRYAVDRTSGTSEKDRREPVRLAVVACGHRLEETLTMLKSAVLFSHRILHFHIFAEDELHTGFRDALESWPSRFRSKFNYTTYPIIFPSDNAKEWKRLFKPCASQRLFLPLILSEVDSVLYVDTDILFLQPVEEIWNFLSQFNSSHIAAMAPEHEEPRIAWYNRFARHPYYGRTGVNSGVMLMNMTRIRAKHFRNGMTPVHLSWGDLLMPLLQKYKLNITWGDQDLLNIIFHYNPESLFVFPCHWNYRPDHCIYGSNCAAAEEHGVYILHGNRGVYHDDKQPAFRAIYEAIHNYPFGDDAVRLLLRPLEEKLKNSLHTYCGKSGHIFTKKLQESVLALQSDNHNAR